MLSSLNKVSTNRLIGDATSKTTGNAIRRAVNHDLIQTCKNVFVSPKFIKTTVKETIPEVIMPVKNAETILRLKPFLTIKCA